jgi:hypothetical protein
MAATLGEILPQLLQQVLGVPQAAAAGPGPGPGGGPGAGPAFEPDDISELLQSLQFKGSPAAPPTGPGGMLEHLQKAMAPMVPGTTSVARQGPAAPPLRRMPGTGSDYAASPPAAPPVAPGTAGPMLPGTAGSAPASGGLADQLRGLVQQLLGGAPTDFARGNQANERPAVDLARTPATGVVRTDPTGAARRPTDFAAGTEANERPGVPDGMLAQLRNAMSAAMPGPAGAPTNIDGMDQRPARQVYEGGRLQPNVPAFGRPRTQVATDQDAPLAETITRGAEQAQAGRAAANPWSGDNAPNTIMTLLARALQGMGQVDSRQPGLVAAGQGASGAIRAGTEAQDREQRRKLAESQSTRADRADTRADRADIRAEETHGLNLQKLEAEVRRLNGGPLTPDQKLKLQQVAATLYRSGRGGAVRAATAEEINRDADAIYGNLAQRHGLPGTAPVGGLPAPGAPAPAQSGAPRAAAPAPSAASGAARGAGVPMNGTYTAADGKTYKRVGPGNTQADWQLVQ